MKELRLRTAYALGIFLVAGAAFGVTTVFGPRTFTRASGPPQTFTETIAVDSAQVCGGTAAFVAVIENSDVTSGEIALNGEILLAESDFKQGQPPREVSLRLGASNTLRVTLKGGRPGSAITISIRKEIHADLTPPATYTLASRQSTFTQSIALAAALPQAAIAVRLGDSRPKSFSLRLNGSEIASTKDVTGTQALVYAGLQTNNTLTVEVIGDSGNSVEVGVRRIAGDSCGPVVRIDSPAQGAIVATSRISVSGIVMAPSRDIGVTVNGRVAEVDLWHAGTETDPFRFFATFEAEGGALDLEATVIDGSGAKGTALRSVTVSPAPEPFKLRAAVDHGVAPFAASFTVVTETPERLQSYDIDYNGDGTYEVLNATSLTAELAHDYAEPRIYTTRFRARDTAGVIYDSVAYIAVQHPAAIDAIVQARWRQLREALAAQDVEGALTLFTGDARGKYRIVLTSLFDALPAMAQAMDTQNPAALSIGADDAEYLVTRMEGTKKKGYYLTLVRDTTGAWKIADF